MFPKVVQFRGQQFFFAFYFGIDLACNIMHLPLFIHHIFSPWKFSTPKILKQLISIVIFLIEIQRFASKIGSINVGDLIVTRRCNID
jgi:hypothetical protein